MPAFGSGRILSALVLITACSALPADARWRHYGYHWYGRAWYNYQNHGDEVRRDHAPVFCQLIVIPLFNDHKLLTQVAGHGNHTIKLLPTLTISDEDCHLIERSFDTVIANAHRTTGAVWKLGKTLVGKCCSSTINRSAACLNLGVATGRCTATYAR